MQSVSAKTILSPYNKNGWFSTHYTINLYRGCCHGCIYCDSRSLCYGVDPFETITKKANALEILERELRTKRKTGVVMTGAMSDPYNPFEEGERLTSGALELIDRYGFGVMLLTKSSRVLRDVGLLQKIARHSPACVQITITAADDAMSKKIEPFAPASSERFEAVQALNAADIPCGVMITPTLPFITDTKENITALVQQAAKAKAAWITYEGGFGVTLRDRQRDYFYQKLDVLFPGLKQAYIQAFGDSYMCISPNSAALHTCFTKACEAGSLIYKRKDIVQKIHGGFLPEQLSLFP